MASNFELATSIEKRSQLDRWAKRSKTRKRFLWTAYLVGAVPVVLASWVFGVYALIQSSQSPSIGQFLAGALFSSLWGVCCTGPMILLPCWALIRGGLSNYEETMESLKEQRRVCEVCGVVALFDDKYVYPIKRKKHTTADLVPHMNVIEEDMKINVLCDACLIEVNSIEQSQ
ncbi:MAG: hypothetical protein AAGI37_10750 [Planctomycetota bacterium]